jgi:hypothetical protein
MRRKAREHAAATRAPLIMKRRRPKRSRNQPMKGSATSPAMPATPTTRPAVSSPPPRWSTHTGSKKKKAKLRK